MFAVLMFAAVLAAAEAPPAVARELVPDIRPAREAFDIAYARLAPLGVTEGSAALDCTVRQGGFLEACEVAEESAPGVGDVVMRMHELYRFTRPPSQGGPRVGERVRVRATLQAPGAPPSTGPDGPMILDGPITVVRFPTWDEVARFYPDRAQRQEIEGTVYLRCVITADELLDFCEVRQETPADMEFGAAALKIARHYRVAPPTVGGELVVGYPVYVPMVFRMPR